MWSIYYAAGVVIGSSDPAENRNRCGLAIMEINSRRENIFLFLKKDPNK